MSEEVRPRKAAEENLTGDQADKDGSTGMRNEPRKFSSFFFHPRPILPRRTSDSWVR